MVRREAAARRAEGRRRSKFPRRKFYHTVRLYFRLNFSYRDVEEMMKVRGSSQYEKIRHGCEVRSELRNNSRRGTRPGDDGIRRGSPHHGHTLTWRG